MVKSKTKISKQLERKTNSELVETIILAKKNSAWLIVAERLSGPRKNLKNLNLNELDKVSNGSKIVIVPGKILSEGEFSNKVKVVALRFSEKAKEKLLNAGCEISNILDEIKSNPSGKDIKILN